MAGSLHSVKWENQKVKRSIRFEKKAQDAAHGSLEHRQSDADSLSKRRLGQQRRHEARGGWAHHHTQLRRLGWLVRWMGIPLKLQAAILCMEKRNPFRTTWNHGKPWFVGIYRGIIIPGFLRWCRTSSIHSGKTMFSVYRGHSNLFHFGKTEPFERR